MRVQTQEEAPGKRKEAWTRHEHLCFLKGLDIFGENWPKVHYMVRETRTLAQVQAHGQSFLKRQKRAGELKKRSIHSINLEILYELERQEGTNVGFDFSRPPEDEAVAPVKKTRAVRATASDE